jgi:glucosamine 6-phosphate synthetase-like amidotransferase/phosphosugar isomerase protein
MCGIVGFTGSRAAAPILLNGLSMLEYRGYGADRVEKQVRVIREREDEQKRQRRMQRQRHSIGAR